MDSIQGAKLDVGVRVWRSLTLDPADGMKARINATDST
jgi:hypothetical protein